MWPGMAGRGGGLCWRFLVCATDMKQRDPHKTIMLDVPFFGFKVAKLRA